MSTNHNEPLYGNREEILPKDYQDYYLFLLELFVKQATGSRLAKLNQMFYVPTSVHFGFLDFVDDYDLELTPVGPLFQPQVGLANDTEMFNSGKSIMFAVDHNAVMDSTIKMIMKFTVMKKMPDNIKPDVLVGTGELDLSGQYAALRLETLQCWRKGITTSKMFDGQVSLIYNGDLAGNLDIFVRITGLGQTIVTKFDSPMPRDSRTFIFSAEEIDDNLTYKCRKMNSRDIDLREDLSLNSISDPLKDPCIPCGKVAIIQRKDEKICEKADSVKTLQYMPSRKLIQSSRGPTQPCGKPVVLKVSGLFNDNDSEKKPTVTVGDESAAVMPGYQSNPDHDIFILRIGKKGLVDIGEKSDIQIEMKTPKGTERRPPIRYETREMQTEVEDEPTLKIKKKKKKK